MPYEIVYTPEATWEVRGLRAHDRRIILDGVDRHLTHGAEQIGRSRVKRLEQPAISTYRLRLGHFRVYYDIDRDANRVLIVKVFRKGAQGTPEGVNT